MKEIVEFQGAIIEVKGSNKDIGPQAAPKDVKEPEDGQVLMKVSNLLGQGRDLVIINK